MGEDDELGYLGGITSGADDDELGYLGNVETNDDELGYLSSYIESSFPELAGDTALSTQLGKALKTVGADAFNSLKNTFMKDGKVDWRSVAGAAGGLYGLYQANKPQEKVGYQGSIPKYDAVRQQVDYSRDTARRPGEAGRQFFTAPQFVKQGDTDALTAAKAAATKQATDIQNQAFFDQRFLKRPGDFSVTGGPVGTELPPSTSVTSPAGGGTAAVMPRAASSVIENLKVPTYTEENAFDTLPVITDTEFIPDYAAGGLTGLYGADVDSLYSDNVTRKKEDYAVGGLASMAQGRYLSGATDGMADKIPARIGNKQEARLSHGEFVFPADVVSHLGNGNSEAGAQRLYAMMDKIRKARTGNTKQGKQINPDKFLA